MWDVSEPFHYVRTFAGRELWVGGEDMPDVEVTKEREYVAFDRVDAYTRDVLGLAALTRVGSWSGTFFQTARTLPYIGTDPRTGIAYSIGFGGSGLLMSFVSGFLHDAWGRGEHLSYQPLFSLDE